MKKSLKFKYFLPIASVLLMVFAVCMLTAYAADLSSTVTPSTVESGTSNQQLNFTVDNTDSTYNITQVEITIPGGFVFITDSNSTSASNVLFSNTSTVLTWDNITASGFIENVTVQYFLFNVTVPSGTGTFNFTVNISDTEYASNTTNVTITVSDTIDPTIDNVSTSTVGPTTATVIWDTNENSNSTVYYGTSQGALSSNTTDASQVTQHPVGLTGLSMKTTYYYNVSSCDAANNCNTSGTYNFTTSCTESWSCGSWSMCYGLQIRTCVDSNGCGTTVNRPSESRACSVGGVRKPVPEPPPKVKHTWTNINTGATVSMNINKSGLDFTKIEFSVKNQALGVSITVTKLEGEPASVTHNVTGKVYQYIQIDVAKLDDANVEKSTITFKVSKSWMNNNNIDKSGISLNRYAIRWDKMEATPVDEDSENVYYITETPGFSYFAITGEEVTAAPPEEVCNNNGVCDSGENFQNCPSDCQEEQPTQTCTPGEKTCSGLEVQECNTEGTEYDTVETCQYDCANGKCGQPPADYTGIILAVIAVVVLAVIFYAMSNKKFRKKFRKKLGIK